jgi:ATP-dependent DNA helicase DinG
MQAAKRFSLETIATLRAAIDDAGGNEVFALGYCGAKGMVNRLEITARGNKDSVLALGFFDFSPESGETPDLLIHNHPSGFLTPSDNDMAIAAKAAESGLGFYIVDNRVQQVYAAAEPIRKRKRKKLNPDKLCGALEEEGSIARRLPEYERRDSQLDLVRLIIRSFNEDSIVVAEAGTGVGKSFAYLLPAVEFALLNGERIVLSTATITLQQQLFEKDIPLVLSALGKKIKCALIKGRGNYLCRRRLTEALREPFLDGEECGELRSIAAWAEQTKTGGRSDLSSMPSAASWSQVCCEADTCLGMRCAERERCFFLALRRESADARILVVNHHLLFADLAARYEGAGYEGTVVLPPYSRIVIDEAHTIENAATSFFSREWSRVGIHRALSRLYRKRRARELGLLLRLFGAGPDSGDRLPGGLPRRVAAAREKAEQAGAAALALCGSEGLFRLTPDTAEDAAPLFLSLGELRQALAALADQILPLLETADQDDPAAWEIRAILRRLGSVGAVCSAFLDYGERVRGAREKGLGLEEDPEESRDVFWMERQGGTLDPWVVFRATPVSVAPSLRDALFNNAKTVVCISATLSTASREGGGDFRFWADRTGAALADRDFLWGIFPSPFPYKEHTLLTVPTDAPLPNFPAYQDFLGRAIAELVLIAGGSALVLFTSYQSLRLAFEQAAPVLEKEGIRCLRQGDDDRSRLLSLFLGDKSSVLFGTDSFWEGVDAPGETLRLLIICRLPFRTLRDPVFEARREVLEKRGANAFMELSLPDAVMKFKQGFGRLMRGSSDYGTVAVLDGRILQKYYGKAFLNALPETRISFKDFTGITRDMERFFT